LWDIFGEGGLLVKDLIKPHGGRLVNRVLKTERRADAKARALTLPAIRVRSELRGDAENIAKGVYSPLEGFLDRDDFFSVVRDGALQNGLPWTIPIVLDASPDDARGLPEGGDIALVSDDGSPFAIMRVDCKYEYDKAEAAAAVFGTTEEAHPGVARLYGWGDVLIGGRIELLEERDNPFSDVTLEPRESRVLFGEKGWKSVVAFQTRNVPHAGHENLQKTVLGLVDGLLIQPVIGRKKPGDFRDDVIIEAYKVLIDNYFEKDRVVLSILPMEMRYAGPREAIHHAIIRKNYGCTHIIIGRDHAGVGNYYDKEAAIQIFDRYTDMDIKPITVRGDFFYCRKCKHLASERTCPHGDEYRVPFSGTEIRKMVAEKRTPPEEIMRPEVFQVLTQVESAFVG
jgi:sulfate adenylyltransferase